MHAITIQKGITMIPGRLSRNLLIEPMVSNSYIIEDQDEVIVFDPACGRKTEQTIKSYLQGRYIEGANWKRGIVIAGHSHMDHANNFVVANYLRTQKVNVFLHESGFSDNKPMNIPNHFITKELTASMKQYNVFRSFFFPYNLLLFPFYILSCFSPDSAVRWTSYLTSLPMPGARNGKISPRPLREKDLKTIKIGKELLIKGWELGDKIILPSPGHSPCSVSLLCLKQKVIFISDAAWFGNPVFLSGSVKKGIESLLTIKTLVQKEVVELLLPAHGTVKKGKNEILTHIEYHIRLLESIREEVLACFHSSEKKTILELSRNLIRNSPLFRFFKQNNYPRGVVFINNMICICLKEAGLKIM